MTERAPIGVLLMAYGGPDSLDDIAGYLADIRGGRTTPRDVLREITGNYKAIGGRSPLIDHTRCQASAIAQLLERDGQNFQIYLGMRHWSPWIEDSVGQMIEQGIERAVSLVLAPQYSGMSIAKYQGRVEEGLEMYRGRVEFAHVDSYHDAKGLIEALAERVRIGLSRWPDVERNQVHVVFSAHSLPSRVTRCGDPYDTQARETARLVAREAGIPDESWSWSYQSAGRSAEPWLGPSLRDHLASLAAREVLDVVIVPVGFVSDHVEILYDIDIDARHLADELGMRLERPPALNDDPVFMRQLADLIVARATAAQWI